VGSGVLFGEFGGFDDRVAFGVEDGCELDGVAADGAVFDEALAAAGGGVDGDEVGLEATGAGVGGVAFQGHWAAFPGVDGHTLERFPSGSRGPLILAGEACYTGVYSGRGPYFLCRRPNLG